jgi:tetratricopeptide (TPR) repeat protein
MQYINPFHLLNIRSENLSDIDSSTIRRAKNKLIADIELSDNKTIEFLGFELTKSDCIRIIDELDNNDKKEFHFFVFRNSDLNLFLTKGDLSFFKNYKAESIYKLDDFLDFISPYYTEQYSKALSNNYKKQDLKNIRHLLFVEPIVNKRDIEDCYKSTYSVIQNIKKEIIQTAKNIENNQSKHVKNDFQDLPKELQKQVNVELLNLLPSYFQSVRNQIAQSIRSLSTTINNTPFEVYKPAFEIISLAYNISTDGLVKQSITKGYFIIKGNYDKYGPKEITGSNKITTSSDNNLPEPLKVKFEAKVSKKSIALNEKFRIEFSMNFDGDNFIEPLFNGFNILSGPSQQVSQSWVDGKSVFNKTYSYFLMPKQKGPLTIEAASIEYSGKIYKTDSIKINSPIIFSPNRQFDFNTVDSNKEKESKTLSYYIFLCVVFAIGFFFEQVQKIILGLSLLVLIIPIIFFRKDNGFSTIKFLKKNIVFISFAGFGIIYPIIAQLYISYYFLTYLISLYGSILGRKPRKFLIYDLMFTAVILTFSYNVYLLVDAKPAINNVANHQIEEVTTSDENSQKGMSDVNQSELNESIIRFNKAINLDPNDVEAYGGRGVSLQHLQRYKEAIDDFLKAEKLGLNTTSLYSNLGFSYYKLNESAKALFYLEKAIDLEEFNEEALRYRGEIKYNNDDYNGAVTDYSKAIKINPNASNYFARGLAFYYLKEFNDALKDINKAIELNPNNGQYFYDRGDTKELMNDLDGANKDWATAKEKGYDVSNYKINKYARLLVNVPNGQLLGCDVTPSYNKKLDNKLLITVGRNASVAVKLIRVNNSECIRYVFINKNSEYSIRNIPEGIYYLKIAYGNDWSKIRDQSECSGRFTKNTLFEKGEEILNFNLVHSGNSYKVPSFSLKLDVIISDDKMSTFNTDKINENDFYNE